MHIYERMRQWDDLTGGRFLEMYDEMIRYKVATFHFNRAQVEQAVVRDREQAVEPPKEPAPPLRTARKRG